MYKLNTNDVTYYMLLDDIDLVSLRRHFDGPPKPLWSVPSGEEYCQFKLNAWRIPDNDEEEDIDELAVESKICHICNIYVPIMYIKEHNNSEKHNNMKKIVDLIILRGRNGVLDTPEIPERAKTSYYCRECSMAVLKTNKEIHEASYTHKKSLRNENLIEKFLKFYSENLNKKSLKTPALQEYFNKFLNKKDLSLKVNVIDEDFITINIKDEQLRIHNNNFHGFVETDEELICIICELQVINTVNLVKQHIESKKHRKKVIRNIDDKHCIREINQDFAHCMLCNELLLLVRVYQHKYLPCHRLNLNHARGKTNGKDFNKNSKETGNIIFGNLLTDELSDEESLIEDSIEESDEDGEVDNNLHIRLDNNMPHREKIKCNSTEVTNKTYCNTCSVYIDTHNFENHKFGSIHKQLESNKNKVEEIALKKFRDSLNLDVTAEFIDENKQFSKAEVKSTKLLNTAHQSNVNAINFPKDTTSVKIHYHMQQSTNNYVSCRICDVNVPIESMNSHINEANHITKYNNLLDINTIIRKNDIFYCQICDSCVPYKCELSHISGVKHKKSFNKVKETCTESNNNSEYKHDCKINEKTHIEETELNTENTTLLSEATKSPKDNTNQDLEIETIEIPVDFIENINYLTIETSVEKEIICKVCDILTSNTDLNIYNHFNGDEHMAKYNELLKANRVTKAQNKFFCYACKVPITNKNELEHIIGVRHKKKMPNNVIDFAYIYCEFCKVLILDTVEEHQNSETHVQTSMPNKNIKPQIPEEAIASTSNINSQISNGKSESVSAATIDKHSVNDTVNRNVVFHKPYYHVTKTSIPSEVFCKICNVTLTNSMVNIDYHIMGMKHTNKYKILLDSNKLRKEDGRFFCAVCEVHFCNKNEIEHIFGFKHKANLANKTESSNNILCDVCDIYLPSNCMASHIHSSEHLNILAVKQIRSEFEEFNKQFRSEIEEFNKELKLLRGNSSGSNKRSGRR